MPQKKAKKATQYKKKKSPDPRFAPKRSKSKAIKSTVSKAKKARVAKKVDRMIRGQAFPDMRFTPSRKQHKEYRESIGLKPWKPKGRKGKNILKKFKNLR